jgi:MATE family multidrug resistance protein
MLVRATARSPELEHHLRSEIIPARLIGRTLWLRELRALAALSWPLALSNLAQMAMGTTDLMMMGSLGPDTLAAGALGSNLYFLLMIFGIGLTNAVSPMIARELGRAAPRMADVREVVQQGLWSAAALAVPSWLILWWTEPLLRAMGEDPALAALAGAYNHALQWALLPSWGYLVLRSFVSALERPGWALVIAVAAVAVNALANWCLMLGHCGCQPLGIAGSGLATLISSLLMFGALGVVVHAAQPFQAYRVFNSAVAASVGSAARGLAVGAANGGGDEL